MKIVCFCIVIQSCGVKINIESQNTYKIFKEEKFREYVFRHGTKGGDTVLFVAKGDALNKCGKEIRYINPDKLKAITMITSKTDTIVFNYYMLTTNGLKINAGAVAPGDWQYPYSFDCNSIK